MRNFLRSNVVAKPPIHDVLQGVMDDLLLCQAAKLSEGGIGTEVELSVDRSFCYLKLVARSRAISGLLVECEGCYPYKNGHYGKFQSAQALDLTLTLDDDLEIRDSLLAALGDFLEVPNAREVAKIQVLKNSQDRAGINLTFSDNSHVEYSSKSHPDLVNVSDLFQLAKVLREFISSRLPNADF